ncbi:SET_domain-containing protein [Hexamita inflata]|uniref:SET domain-containing protein n=1 Tax=Hexamita inflata TaxID=28002 RepID=A0AA86P9M6_9EUKA|nr:SET domain-containing protein [Hexamita inflata]CAI9937924.1 SET domain-containing protein [Hexamita inflata]
MHKQQFNNKCAQLSSAGDPVSLKNLCQTSVENLKQISIKDLIKKTVMTDTILWGFQITKPIQMVGINFVIEDDQHDAIEVAIYNQLPVRSPIKKLDALLFPGCKIGIKNPYLRCCSDGNFMLRNDNPSNIIIQRPNEPIEIKPVQAQSENAIENEVKEIVKIPIAEYYGSTIIKVTNSNGRGLFAFKNIARGTNIVVERSLGKNNENASNFVMLNIVGNKMNTNSQSNLNNMLVIEQTNDEILRAKLNCLYAGNMRTDCPNIKQIRLNNFKDFDTSFVSAEMIYQIVKFNSFGGENEQCNLFFIISFANHAKQPNACLVQEGEFHILKALRNIKADEEITIDYVGGIQNRKEALLNWGITRE